jgi:hypothetical protein
MKKLHSLILFLVLIAALILPAAVFRPDLPLYGERV